MESLKGLGVALVTPFTAKGNIDFDALLKLLKHTATGVDYWVVMGSTGEAITLTHQEQSEVLSFIKQNNPGNLPIVFGLGGSNTQELLNRLKQLDLTGVTALLSSSPAYNKPSQQGIIKHFTTLANAAPIPVLLYNVPGRTASNMEAATTLELAQHPNIIGIKEASGNLIQVMEIIAHAPGNFLVTSGDDLLTPAITAMGGQGLISVLANALPGKFNRMVHSALNGDVTTSRTQAFELLQLNELMYLEGNPTGIKALLALKGIGTPYVRLPLVPASAALTQRIAMQYKQLN